MSSTHDYNTRRKEVSDFKIIDEISKLREELVENLKKNFTDFKDEIINLKACVRNFLSNGYFSPNDSPSKTLKKVFFIATKMIFSFSRYSTFCTFVFPSFFPFQPLL